MLKCLLSTDANRVSFDYSVSAVGFVLFVLFIIAYTPTVIWYTRRKYQQKFNYLLSDTEKTK